MGLLVPAPASKASPGCLEASSPQDLPYPTPVSASCHSQNLVALGLLQFEYGMSSKGSGVEVLAPSWWCFGEVIRTLRGRESLGELDHWRNAFGGNILSLDSSNLSAS